MKTIKNLLLIATGLVAILLLANCSDKSFTANEPTVRPRCVDDPIEGCVLTCDDAGTCQKDYDYEIDAATGIADILFVVDNSGSMSQEQREMGTKFPSFLNSVANLDYRIGITTTDVPATGGQLLPFRSGQSFLDGTYDLATEQDLFLQTVQRRETIECENSGYVFEHCPSGDERGLLASYMTLANNYNSFVRDTGHLALIFLSDEDERSEGHGLESMEIPSNFLTAAQQMFPSKSIKAHSIIIRPGDSTCLGQQSSGQTPRGFYGDVYAELSSLTGGIIGDICASNYSDQLQAIGEDVAQPRQILHCQPLNDEVSVTFIPEPPYTVNVTKNLANREILFSTGLPKGTKIRIQFSCSQ